MKYSFALLFSFLVACIIFTSTLNLFLVLHEAAGYVNGIRIDYLMPKLYLSDIFIILTIVITFLQKKTWSPFKIVFQKNRVLIGLLSLIVLTGILFSRLPLAIYSAAIKIFFLLLLVYVIVTNKKIIKPHIVTASLYLVLIIQTSIAMFQFLFQHSVTPYWLLGETQFTSSSIGIAQATLFAQEKILSYGTTAHPNVLAGITILFSFLLQSFYIKTLSGKNIFLLANALLIIFLTQSLSALLALLLGIIIIGFHKHIVTNAKTKKRVFLLGFISFFLVPIINWLAVILVPDSYSIFRRYQLNVAAIKIFVAHPIIGVGLGTVTGSIEKYLEHKELVRFIQPPHHIGMVWLAETGLLGVTTVILFLKKYYHYIFALSPIILVLLPLASLDHYLLTIQAGLVSTILFCTLIDSKKIN